MERRTIAVTAAHTPLGQEICRLTVAAGHRPIGVVPDGRPTSDDPWLEGVEWVTVRDDAPQQWHDRLDAVFAVVHLSDAPSPALAEACRAAGVERLIRLTNQDQPLAGPAREDTAVEETAVLRIPPLLSADEVGLAGDPNPDAVDQGLRVERVAMAALRAALEPDVGGRLSPDQVAHLGDAMMIQ